MGVTHFFHNLILFYIVFNKLQDAFYVKNSKQFLRYSPSKSEATIGFLYEAQTKTANN